MKLFLLLTIFTVIFACHTSKPIKTMVTTPVAVSEIPNDSLIEVNRKKRLYEQNCASCHDLAKPSSETASEWKKIVPRMVAMINTNTLIVDEKDEKDILSYLIANCKK